MRFAIFLAALGAACLSMPAQAAQVFLQFTVYTSGSRLTFVPCTMAGAQTTCPEAASINPVFSYAQSFNFVNGVSVNEIGFYSQPNGQVDFTIRDLGSNLYRIEDFNYSKAPQGSYPYGIPAGVVIENATAPNFVISSVPEPATWGLMILGFGAMGAALRRRSAKVKFA